MIPKMLNAALTGLVYIKNHTQILFALVLLIVLPLLFLYTGSQFLEVGRSNQDRILKDRIGLMHDTLASLLSATSFSVERTGGELAKILANNNDFVDYALVKKEGAVLVYVDSYDTALIGQSVQNTSLYVNASLRDDESLIFEFTENDTRYWAAYRAVTDENTGELYFMYTLFTQEHIDNLFAARERTAYISLGFIYLFMIALAYWHIRLTDYRYLFIKAEKASQMKDIFTHMIAHELRSPLTAIRGYADLLKGQLTEPKEREQAGRIKESAERLLAIVNDLLDVARIQSGKMAVTKEKVNVSTVIQAVLGELTVTAAEKSITLVTEGVGVVHELEADPKRLHQAFTNLVSNAIKYTPKGTITICLEDRHASLEVRVKDTGMGISAEDQQKLFAPFFRVSTPDVTQITGTGLGMWITKQLIEIMGGKIGVESIKGVGTQIVVSLPKAIRL